MKQQANDGHGGEINRNDRSRRERVGNSALENNVDVHQPVANDGVAEAQWDKDQGECRCRHPSRGDDAREDWNNIKRKEWDYADESAEGDPLQLLPQQAGGRTKITEQKNYARRQKVHAPVSELNLIEAEAAFNRRHQVECCSGHAHVQKKQRGRHGVNGGKPEFQIADAALRKNEREMDKKGGLQKKSNDV